MNPNPLKMVWLKQSKQSSKALYKLQLTNILKIRFFDHHPIPSIMSELGK